MCFAIAFSSVSFFLLMFQTHVSSVSSVFRLMLQMFHLNVLKVNRVSLLQGPTYPPAAAAGAPPTMR
jgi:hypothetical protein